MFVDEDGEFFWFVVIAVVFYAAGNYGSQVYDNYERGYHGTDAWFKQVDFFDVLISGIAGGLSAVFPAAAPFIQYATSPVQNAVDYRPASQWKSVFHSGDRNISLKDWVINSGIDLMITYTTSIWRKRLETPKSRELEKPKPKGDKKTLKTHKVEAVKNIVEEGLNNVMQHRLKTVTNPDNRFHEDKLPKLPPGMQEPIDNRCPRNDENMPDIVFGKTIPDARLLLLYKVR